jgi:hypothetical protein
MIILRAQITWNKFYSRTIEFREIYNTDNTRVGTTPYVFGICLVNEYEFLHILIWLLLFPNGYSHLTLFFQDPVGISNVLLCCSLGPYCEPDAENPVNNCLDKHDIPSRGKARIVNTIQVVE